MSFLQSRRDIGAAQTPMVRTRCSTWPLIVLASILSTAMGWGIASSVWNSGYFGDTDDALRMVQVRDLLAGQSWYDLRAHRLGPSDGLLLHWSRIIDVPLALLVKSAGIIFPAREAELAARLAFPFLLSIALFWAIARAARTLMGEPAIIPSIVLCVLTGVGLGQFQPGRIDHHAPQIVLLVLMLAFILEALKGGEVRPSLFAGFAAALSLGISVENLPFIVSMSALLPLYWLINPEGACRPLRAFGIGLASALIIVFASTIEPARWGQAVCDSLSIAYAAPAMAGAIACIVLANISHAQSGTKRALWVAGAGIVTLSSLLLFPQCLRGPLDEVDPLLRSYWLNNVGEARSLLSALANDTRYTILVMLPPLICAVFALWPSRACPPSDRAAWIVTCSFLGTGVLTTFWQIRAGFSLAPLSVLPATWLVLRFRHFLESQKLNTAMVLSLSLALPLTSTGWAIGYATLPIAKAAVAVSGSNVKSLDTAINCFKSDNYNAAAKLPAGLVVAPIDVGAHMLAFSGHKVLAAAYHRNNLGNRKALDILFAEPTQAELLVRNVKADYVAVCMGRAELDLIKSFAPNGLAIGLADGRIPLWLEEITLAGAHLRIFSVRPPN